MPLPVNFRIMNALDKAAITAVDLARASPVSVYTGFKLMI